ncbi:hypothetical protein BDR06DRAFT_170612 [Suillus hirtellus]|nr:hypothetical protein BDR06DRAFT_170612 [Suillus hirtellus]
MKITLDPCWLSICPICFGVCCVASGRTSTQRDISMFSNLLGGALMTTFVVTCARTSDKYDFGRDMSSSRRLVFVNTCERLNYTQYSES